jgi:amino acid transporter
MEKKNVFVRESTGLVKSVSFLDALSLNLGSMEVGLALASIGYTMVLLPSITGVNMIVASFIAAALVIPQVIVYHMFLKRVTRTGGDYVWATRSIGSSGGVLAFGGVIMIQLAYSALTVLAIIFAIGSVGVALGFNSFLPLALPGNIAGSAPALQLLLGAAIFAILIAVNILRPKAGFRLVSVSIVLGLLLLAFASAALLIAGHSGVVGFINGLGATGANNAPITYNSLASSYTGPTFNLVNTLIFSLFYIFYSYPWFATGAPTAASEFKGSNPARFSIPLSFILTFLFTTIPVAIMYYVGGFGFVTAAFSNPTLVYNYSLNFWTLAMGASGNMIVSAIIGVGWILWDLALLGYLIISFSRYVLAASFDRLLPARLSGVSRFGSPWAAQVFDLIITLAVAGLAAFFYGPFSSLYGIGDNNWVWFITIGIAATIYGVRKLNGRGKLIMASAGILMTIVYLFVLYVFLEYPTTWGGNDLGYGYDIAVFLCGAAIYLGMKYYYRAKGVDIGLAFKEIPPE